MNHPTNTSSWLREEQIMPYLFFHVNFWNKHQSSNNWLKDQISNFGANNADTIIDLGCGTGNITVILAQIFRFVIGIDSSKQMLNVAKSRAKEENIENVTFMKGNMLNPGISTAQNAFTSSLGHLLGQDTKIKFFDSLQEIDELKYIYICP